MAILPARFTCDEVRQLVAAHVPRVVANITSSAVPGRLVLRQRHDGGDALALLQRQHVDQRLAARLRRRQRQAPDLFLVDLAARREEQHRRVGRGDEQPGDEILVARLHAGAALAAALLRAIGRQRHALDVAGMADGDDHVLALDQVLVLDLAGVVEIIGAARRRELVLDRVSSSLMMPNRSARASAGCRDNRRSRRELVQLLGDFLAAERGQALQAQIEDGARLRLGQAVGAVVVERWRGSAISAISGAMSCAGQSRAISASRAAAASGDVRMSG
jgi:hypothetical protein